MRLDGHVKDSSIVPIYRTDGEWVAVFVNGICLM